MADALIRKRTTSVDELNKLAAEGTLFAVIDACDEPEVPAKIEELGRARSACLYRGELDQETKEVAPYLVSVDRDLLAWIFTTSGERPWGIFVVAKSDLRTLRQHLRQFLTVQGIDEKPMYFFYYDPRVIVTFLESCDQEELDEFYGPVMAYGVTAEGAQAVDLIVRE